MATCGLRRSVEPGTAAALGQLIAEDPDPRVRAAALGALVRLGAACPEATAPLPDGAVAAWIRAAADPDASVRRRAADLAPSFLAGSAPDRLDTRRGLGGASAQRSDAAPGLAALVGMLGDHEAGVAEAAAWALGELGEGAVRARAVQRLAEVAGDHRDPLVREAAVAALGSLGDPAGLPAVLAACADKVAIRRRGVLALAAFDGPEVDAALQTALTDRDWQTRQAAEDLLGAPGQD